MDPILQQRQAERYQKDFQKDMLEPWDAPDKEVKVCAKFGCAAHLTLLEALAGDFCTKHSMPVEAVDVSKFISY